MHLLERERRGGSVDVIRTGRGGEVAFLGGGMWGLGMGIIVRY